MLATIDRNAEAAHDAHNGLWGRPASAPTPSGSRPAWFCAATHSQAEQWAEANLRRQGYRTLLPMVPAKRRDKVIRSLLHEISVPLWPGYVFVAFDRHRDPWRPINNTPGVWRLIGDATGPRALRAGVLEAVQAAVVEAATRRPGRRLWAPGTPCSPVAGVFSGHPAIVVREGADMVVVAILMLGELREVAIQADNLQVREA